MANKIPQPGVFVTQTLQTFNPTIFNPSLVPFVTGPAKEIVKVLDSAGNINADAKQGTYVQLPKLISQTAFPSPRGNITEVIVEKPSIKAFYYFGGVLKEFKRDPGESFLKSWNFATRATIRTNLEPAGPNGWDLNPIAGPKTLTLVIDNPARLNTAKDVTITFTSVGNARLLAADVAAQINAAWGSEIAFVRTLTGEVRARVEIVSGKYGATSSVTIRGGGSANTILGFNATEDRVEGSGFRGVDQANNTTATQYVEWSRGNYLSNGTIAAFPVGVQYGLSNENGVFTNGQAAALNFTTTIPLKVGDYMVSDGVRIGNALITKVDPDKIKLGIVNAQLSTYDDKGNLVVAVYDPVYVRTIFDGTPFAPQYTWFEAENLTFPQTNTAAELLGANSGVAAESATIMSTANITFPVALSGLNIKVTTTVDDVEQPEQILTFAATANDIAALKALIGGNIAGVTADNDGDKLILKTTKLGKAQGIRLNKTSTANLSLSFDIVADTTDVGKDVEFVDIAPKLTATVDQTFNVVLAAGDKITLEVTNDNFVTVTPVTYTWAGGATLNNIGALVGDLNTNLIGAAPNNIVWSNVANRLSVSTVTHKGALAGVRIKNNGADNTGLGAGKVLGFALGASANGVNGISAEPFKFILNERNKVYTVVFQTDSLTDAINDINNLVGTTIAYAGGGGLDKLRLVSTLKGVASKIEVVADSTTLNSNLQFGFNTVAPNSSAVGSGRPNPDFYLDVNGNAIIGAEILRDPVTGRPFDPAQADIYIQYTGLRKDLSPSAKDPLLLRVATIEELTAALSPLTSENPLGFAMLMMMLNAPDIVITGLGIDETTASMPEGTVAAYTRALEFIEPYEVWAMAPLSSDDNVHQLFKEHVLKMSDPMKKRERVVFINPKVPTKQVDTVVSSGLAANAVGTINQLTLDVNPAASLLNNGINPALPIPYSANVFVELTVGTETRKYSVSNVNGVVISLRNTFTATQNTDNYYTKTQLSEVITNQPWSMKIKGADLVIPGTNPPLPDKLKLAETVALKAQQYKNRRVIYTYPDTVITTVNGTEEKVPGYYAAAAYTAVKAATKPQQGLTNFVISGFTGVVKSSAYLSDDHMDILAGGGVWVMINDGKGLPIYCRHQLTTDVSSIQTRELTITSILDHMAKLQRNDLRQFIGTSNITQNLLDRINMVIEGEYSFLINTLGSLKSARKLELYQDPVNPDTVILSELVEVPYPVNKIMVNIIL